jgi:hypothetical protein
MNASAEPTAALFAIPRRELNEHFGGTEIDIVILLGSNALPA